MKYFFRTTLYAMGRLCRQSWLLAGLALLCFLTPVALGQAVEDSFSQGVAFEGITLALAGEEDDAYLPMARELLGSMEELQRYVTFPVMSQEEALQALEAGSVTAVLAVPDSLVEGILSGENPDVVVYVNEEQPLEGLLLYWVGRSATDLLSAVQAGIYSVERSYAAAPPEGLAKWEMLRDINLVYIGWTLERQSVFETVPLSAVGSMDVKEHYSISLLAWLALSMAPVFCVLLDPKRLAPRRRLRALGYGAAVGYFSDFTACAALLFALVAVPLAVLRGPAGLWAAIVFALFCGSFGCLCCLLTGNAARCGALSFLVSLGALALSGGIVPPVMLPDTLRRLLYLSPVTWLRDAVPGHGCPGSSVALLLLSLALMTGLSLLLYRRQLDAGEASE